MWAVQWSLLQLDYVSFDCGMIIKYRIIPSHLWNFIPWHHERQREKWNLIFRKCFNGLLSFELKSSVSFEEWKNKNYIKCKKNRKLFLLNQSHQHQKDNGIFLWIKGDQYIKILQRRKNIMIKFLFNLSKVKF